MAERGQTVSSELVTLTYGALVASLVRDHQDTRLVNAELDRLGFNVGIKMVDEYLAKAGVQGCNTFRDVCQSIAKGALKMFLGVSGAESSKWREDNKQCSIIWKGNPLNDFVELPPALAAAGPSSFSYSLTFICGCVRGALSMLNMVVECTPVRDELCGAADNEIRITLTEVGIFSHV